MTTQEQLDRRYGRRRTTSARWAIGGAAAVGAILAGLLGWTVVSGSIDAIDVRSTGFVVEDDGRVTIDFQLTSPPGRSIACALEAQDEEHGVVGWRIVEYAAAADHARAFRESVRTVSEATTGFVNDCWVT
ncbi:DUF4307 domain-containing protein [Microbacterium sp. NPDC077184]|uniref:DUF4307 domain-containing protein n=1 Tax=Microbacterium sp. NPDC077184 TaxID=3154764 RepID=UPI0034468EF9